MRLFLLLAVVSTSAAADMKCDRMEYAKAKDSTRAELTSAMCSAERQAELNRKMAEIKRDTAKKLLAIGDLRTADSYNKEASASGDARISCMKASADAFDMLHKKFKVSNPPACD